MAGAMTAQGRGDRYLWRLCWRAGSAQRFWFCPAATTVLRVLCVSRRAIR